MNRLACALLLLSLSACSSAEPEPELESIADQRARAPQPAPNAPTDSPPLGDARAKIAPEAAIAAQNGERPMVR